ncbi:MAG: tRNA (guanine(10)-N(2))-dimethyltransferase [Acidilobaceae archaeon]
MYWVIREGNALVKVPALNEAVASHGLEPAWLPVFYNPKMEFNRDLSVIALQAYVSWYAPHRPIIAIEPLSATGVRTLRYALEVEGVMRVYAGDLDYESCKLIEENVRLNSAWDKVSVYCGDANALMYRLRESKVPVLFIDLDPYGSPAPFLDSALTLIGSGGLLAATATDTAVLEGSKSSAALRRYGAVLRRTPHSREVAVRVLLAFMARVAATHDKSVEPLLSLWTDYYVRVFIKVERGAKRALKMLENNIGYLMFCKDSGYVAFDEELMKSCSNVERLGPLWVGDLWSVSFVEKIEELLHSKFSYINTKPKLNKILSLIKEELEIQRYPTQRFDLMASLLKKEVPSRSTLIEKLKNMGFKATRTHFSPLAIRTDADMYSVISAIA